MPEDWIRVRDIRAFGHHGVSTRERKNGQVFEADVELGLDLADASRTNFLADTVDYAEVHLRVKRVVGGKPCRLLEGIAGRVADELFSAYPLVERVVVRLRKPGVASAMRAGDVEVELKRSRKTERTGGPGA